MDYGIGIVGTCPTHTFNADISVRQRQTIGDEDLVNLMKATRRNHDVWKPSGQRSPGLSRVDCDAQRDESLKGTDILKCHVGAICGVGKPQMPLGGATTCFFRFLPKQTPIRSIQTVKRTTQSDRTSTHRCQGESPNSNSNQTFCHTSSSGPVIA